MISLSNIYERIFQEEQQELKNLKAYIYILKLSEDNLKVINWLDENASKLSSNKL